MIIQAGAELCQAQDQLDLPAETELLLSVFRNILSHLPFSLSAMEVFFRLSNFNICFEIYWGRPAIQNISHIDCLQLRLSSREVIFQLLKF